MAVVFRKDNIFIKKTEKNKYKLGCFTKTWVVSGRLTEWRIKWGPFEENI